MTDVAERRKRTQGKTGGWGETVRTVVYAVLIALVVRTFAIEPFNIPSGSMIPTLLFGKVSLAKLRYLLVTGKSISADEAERIGMITEVTPDDALQDRVAEVIREIRQTSPNARALYKEYLNRIVPSAPNAHLYRSLISEECREGLRAFGEKRKAKFST